MKFLFFFIIMGLFSSCVSQDSVSNTNKKKVESSSNSEYTINSNSKFKEEITDPITMDVCDKKLAIKYDNHFFCSEQSIEKYKEQIKE